MPTDLRRQVSRVGTSASGTATGGKSEPIRFQFRLPTEVQFGWRIFDELPRLVRERWPGITRIVVVTGQAAMERAGVLKRLWHHLDEHELTHERVPGTPDLDAVASVCERVRQADAELVIGLGGGSAMDAAKAAAALRYDDRPLQALLDGRQELSHRRVPCLAIPTTAGTGSEVTPWATVWNQQSATKHSLTGPELYPTMALVDPELTLSAPPGLTASTGLDAMTHAIEACWSVRRNPLSTTWALHAIRNINDALPTACARPDDQEARITLALSSLLAGLAFSQTQTAAAHAISYPLTARFGVPHGLACSITVPALLRLNGGAAPDAVVPIAQALGTSTVEAGADALREFMDALPRPRRLREFGIGQGDLLSLARGGLNATRMPNNPYPLTEQEIRRILEEVW